MQVFYTDKGKIFECEIAIEGSSINNTKARMIFEVSNKKFIFEGKIESSGKCSFDIPALKEYNIKGNGTLVMEVIAESTVFEPFNDEIEIKESKKVEVKIVESKENTTPKLSVNVITKQAIVETKQEKLIDEELEKRKSIIKKVAGKIGKITESNLRGYKPSQKIVEFSKQFEGIVNKKDMIKYQYLFDRLTETKNKPQEPQLLKI